MKTEYRTKLIGITGTAICLAIAGAMPAAAQNVIDAYNAAGPMTVDGDASDWSGVPARSVALSGHGNVDTVEVRFAVHGDMIYMLAEWSDTTESRLHKPYRWNPETSSYARTGQLEDRLAISFLISGSFSHDKLSGAEFMADVWHWKASRSDPAGVAHDKYWKVSQSTFPKAKEYKGANGQTVYLARISDGGDRLYRPVKYDLKREDVMPRYDVTMQPQGSIADVRAKGVWLNGRWVLEMARKLDTGHDDDVVFPANGEVPFAVAAFNDVASEHHSNSETMILRITK